MHVIAECKQTRLDKPVTAAGRRRCVCVCTCNRLAGSGALDAHITRTITAQILTIYSRDSTPVRRNRPPRPAYTLGSVRLSLVNPLIHVNIPFPWAVYVNRIFTFLSYLFITNCCCCCCRLKLVDTGMDFFSLSKLCFSSNPKRAVTIIKPVN